MVTKGKSRRRNSDKRKEKSRDAARNRRGKESEVFSDLADQLPLAAHVTAQMDKASIMRLAISHLKLRNLNLVSKDHSSNTKNEEKEPDKKMDHYFLRALEGFVLVLDMEAEMVYLSENVAKYLGLAQVDLMGHSLFDFSHPCDHDEVREVLASHTGDSPLEYTFFVRMKCTLTSKGRNINLKSATYKVIKLSGRVVEGDAAPVSGEAQRYLVLIGEPIPHPSNIEVTLDSKTFLSRHAMDMKFTYCDERIESLLHYDENEMIGKSLYDFHHAVDSEELDKAYKNLFSKGQCVTNRYRFLAKRGGFAWVETQATVIYNSRTDKAQCVVCVHNVISDIEEGDCVLCERQMEAKESVVVEQNVRAKESPVKVEKNEHNPVFTLDDNTMSIFKPRTADMEQAFYIPDGCPENDLTHLAPNAGDVMVPLGIPDRVDQSLCDDLLAMKTKDQDVLMVPVDKSTVEDGDDAETADAGLEPADQPDEEPVPILPTSFSISDMSTFMSELDQMQEICVTKSSFEVTPEEKEVDFDTRAPYIPMSGDTDLIFGVSPVPLFHNFDDGPKTCMGITETVFTPRPPELCPSPVITPLSVLKEQTAREQMPKLPEGEVGMCPPKVKRPVETNRLETGPPVKIPRTDTAGLSVPECRNSMPTTASKDTGKVSTSSVLMNLLLNGEDTSYGYRAHPPEELTQDSAQPGEVAPNEETVITSTVPEMETDPELTAPPETPAARTASTPPAGGATFSAVTLDAAALEQLQRLVTASGPGSGAVVILTPGGLCLLGAGQSSPSAAAAAVTVAAADTQT